MLILKTRFLWLHVLFFACWPTLALVVDSLAVGTGTWSWARIRESSRLISFTTDSIWLWDVELLLLRCATSGRFCGRVSRREVSFFARV